MAQLGFGDRTGDMADGDGGREAGDGAGGNGGSGDRRVAMELGMETRMETGQTEMGARRWCMRMVQAKMVALGSMQVEVKMAREIEARGVVQVME